MAGNNTIEVDTGDLIQAHENHAVDVFATLSRKIVAQSAIEAKLRRDLAEASRLVAMHEEKIASLVAALGKRESEAETSGADTA